MIRSYVVTVEREIADDPRDGLGERAAYVQLGTYRASSPAKARNKAADAWGFTEAETLIAVPERYWQEAVFVPERPTLGLGL